MPSLRIPRRNTSATLTPPSTDAHCIDDCPTPPPVTAPCTVFDPRSPQQQHHPRALVRLHGITFSVLLPVPVLSLLPLMQMQLEHMVAAAASGRTRMRGNVGFTLERRRRRQQRRWPQQSRSSQSSTAADTLIQDDTVEAIVIDEMLLGWSEDLAAALDHYTSVLSQERASLCYLVQHGGVGKEASIKVRRAKQILRDSMKGRKKDLKALQGLKRIM